MSEIDNKDSLIGANSLSYSSQEEDGDLDLHGDSEKQALVADIESKFTASKDARREVEEIWLQSYKNYRGLYQGKTRESEKSRVFVKITKTKVLAAYGMLVDLVFGTGSLPISVGPTKVPEGVAERAHLKVPEGAQVTEKVDVEKEIDPFNVGYKGDEDDVLKPGATHNSTNIPEEFKTAEGTSLLEAGKSPNPEIAQFELAKKIGRRLEKLIHDQIEESKGAKEIRSAMLEACLLGTGIIKGPFNDNKVLHRWEENEEGERTYSPLSVRVPRISFVSCWDFYPDPNATNMGELDYNIERHRLNKSQLRGLSKMPGFKGEAIKACLRDGPNHMDEPHESALRAADGAGTSNASSSKFDVLEYWGVMDKDYVTEAGINVDGITDELDEVQINAWICNGHILRAIINPFTPNRIPYHVFSYEENPYNFFGVGVPENMTDTQLVMNGHARLAIDNLALSGSLVLDIDESMLVPGQDMKIFPGRVFKRQSGQPGQAIHGIKFPNTSQENLMMFDKFRQLSDEATGIPSFSHGQTGIQSMTRTASGMSMLMGAASLNIKTVVKNMDDDLFEPLGKSYFWWNNQFYEGKLEVIGDLEVRATGLSSIMAKEVRSQRLTTVLQTAANPLIAPFVRIPTLVKELAISLDLDPDELLSTPEDQQLMMAMIGNSDGQKFGIAPPNANAEQGGVGGPNGVGPEGKAATLAGTGDGTIAPSPVSVPGEESFSG